jgi:hypothetical protein
MCCRHMFSSVSVILKVCFKCFIMMLQKYIWMLHNMHVSNVCSKCFRCFIRMLDLDVVYVASCDDYTRMFQVFHLFLEVHISIFKIDS